MIGPRPSCSLAGRAGIVSDALALDRAEITVGAGSLSLTASFGVAEYDRVGSLDSLNGLADEALYRAKQEGRDRVIW